MGMEAGGWIEKRINPRIPASGEVLFRAHWISDFYGSNLSLSTYLHADLIDTSIDGMRIKTSFPLNKKDVLERVSQYTDSLRQTELVKWVEKIDDCYCAGLQSVRELSKL